MHASLSSTTLPFIVTDVLSPIKILLTSGPNTWIPMVLRNVLSKCHNFPVNGQRDEGIITGRWAKKEEFSGAWNCESRRERWSRTQALVVQISSSSSHYSPEPHETMGTKKRHYHSGQSNFIKVIILGQNINIMKYYQIKTDC